MVRAPENIYGYVMERRLTTILTEATVIGILNFLIYNSLKRMGVNSNLNLLILSGALLHVLFEYAGLNQWWCESTYRR